jgi:serine protease Do
MKYIGFIALFLYTYTASANDTWDNVRFKGLPAGVTYQISSGTGFYVNRTDIVTNRHVLDQCLNIAVRGAIAPALAEIVIIDKNLDLALIRTASSPKRVPYLRTNYKQISTRDVLFTVGYPLERSNTGEYIIKEAQVLEVNDRTDNTKFTNIEFTDTIDHGNSGGPLLDKNTNIVGVVTAEITTYDAYDPNKIDKTTGMAIGLDGLLDFLTRNNIPYAANSTYDIFTNYNLDDQVKYYVVNIHCVK